MTHFVGYRCSSCGEEYGPGETVMACRKDGSNLDIQLDFHRIGASLSPRQVEQSKDSSMWRYLPLLPVGNPGLEDTALRNVGWTPLLRAERLGQALGLAQLWLKDDGRNPTASFKDRASALVVVRAREIGAEMVVTASTGNAGAALAGMAAAANLPAVILAPRNAPQAKIAQLLIFGARVFLVDGTYDQAFDLSLQAAEAFGWYCRNTGYNPFTAEGKKTAAFEICEQLTAVQGQPLTSAASSIGRQGGGSLATPLGGRMPGGEIRPAGAWTSPDAVLVAVGDGNIISGLHKGFRDLRELGWIERMPRLYGVQAAGSAAVANAFLAGTQQIQPVQADTLADSISVDLPRDGQRALRAARESGGGYLIVRDADILQAVADLGRQAAVFAEPAGAAAFAGLTAAIDHGLVGSDESLVVMITGSGLKDIPAAFQAVAEAPVIEPSLKALEQAFGPG